MEDFPFQAKFEEEMRLARERLGLAIGDIYEDWSWHPVMCVSIDYEEDEITGISLVDGSHPRSCSLRHCGVRKLTVEEAWEIRRFGPTNLDAKNSIAVEKRWWR